MSEVEQKNCCPVVISKDQIIPGTEFYDMWNVGSAPDYKAQVPIFSVYNMHGLNAIIGYVMLINSNAGKVLYRGQTRLYCGENGRYNDLLPSFCHLHPVKGEELKAAKRRWNSEAKANVKSLDKHIEAIINDPDLLKQIAYNFDSGKEDSKAELRVIIESMLQHYGSSTRCMDFVDNHWIALWFGLYQWVSTKNEIGMPVECFYKKRTLKLSRKDRLDSVSHIRCQFFNELKKATSSTSISESQSDVNQLIKNYSYKLAFAEDQYLYLLLFVADTLTEHETTQHSGIYSNSRMTVVDLRRALPSVFLRPGAQHGWTVKMNSNKKNMSRGDYSFAKDVVAILRIPLSLADELIGGALLSQENLFPPADYDQGYRILLQRQEQAAQKGENLTDLDLAFKAMPILKYK